MVYLDRFPQGLSFCLKGFIMPEYPNPVPADWNVVYDTHFQYQIKDLYNPARNGEWIAVCPINGGCGFQQLEKDGKVDSANFRGYSIRYLVYTDDSTNTKIVGHYQKCSSPSCGHAINQSQADYANTFLHNIEPEKVTLEDVDQWMDDLFT